MLDLRSPRWKELSHAYGSAQDIPGLLMQLESAPPKKDYQSEPWFSLWSALCHQGDVYTASYAAVLYILIVGSKKPIPQRMQRMDFLLIAAKIEAMRHTKTAPRIPADLKQSYESSIGEGVSLAMSCLGQKWPEDEYRVVLGALAIFSGHVAFGNMMLDFDGDCQCPNCDTVFAPLGYDILKKE